MSESEQTEAPQAQPDLGPLVIDLPEEMQKALLGAIEKLDPSADAFTAGDKAVLFAKMAIQDWLDWANNRNRETRIDDMTTNRIGDLYAEIIETVPSTSDIAESFSLKPSLAKKVAELFTQAPRPAFRRRTLEALRDALQENLNAAQEPFTIEINKILDQTLKTEEERLHKLDDDFEVRASSKGLFTGSQEVVVRYTKLSSAEKLIAHLCPQIDEAAAQTEGQDDD